jgi:hypothetical protein
MALAFSVLKQIPVRVFNIRAGRGNPGLRAQHLKGNFHLIKLSSWPMPWLGWLLTSLTLCRPGSFHVGFVDHKVALGQVFLQVLWFFPVSIIPLVLHTCISSGA